MQEQTGGSAEEPKNTPEHMVAEQREKLPDPKQADVPPPLVTDELDRLENAARKTSQNLLTDLFLLLIYLTGCTILISIVYLIHKHVARQ
jgi:hypothetical protein